jgi:hypothetical protein
MRTKTREKTRHAEQRRRGRPFQPGQSGNPGGRPKGFASFREQARRFLEEEGGHALLIRLAKQRKSLHTAAFALRLLVEYAYGRPPQPVQMTWRPDLSALSDAELTQLERLAARAAGGAAGPPVH